MLSFLAGLKAKLWIAAGVALACIAAIVRIKSLRYQRDKARYRAKVAQAGLKRKVETEEREAEIHSEWSDTERLANESISDIPAFLRNRRVRKPSD